MRYLATRRLHSQQLILAVTVSHGYLLTALNRLEKYEHSGTARPTLVDLLDWRYSLQGSFQNLKNDLEDRSRSLTMSPFDIDCFTDVSRTRHFPDKTFPVNHFPGQTFPGQVILRNFHVHNVCKYQLCRPSHAICRYTERLLMCACRSAISIRGLFGKACSPTMGKA